MFAEMDGDNSGAVDLREMLAYFGLDMPKKMQVYAHLLHQSSKNRVTGLYSSTVHVINLAAPVATFC